MPATMAEVAERAGVSKSTVSLVLNDKPNVSPQLRQAVLAAASELHYELPPRRTQERTANRSIVIVHYERGESDSLYTTIFVQYVSGIQSFIHNHNINLTFVTDYREEYQQLGYRLLNDGHLHADGAILMGWSARREGTLLQRFLDTGVPVVVLSRNWPDLPISTVGQDHRQQANIALDHLVDLGHRQIAFLADRKDQRHEWYTWRLNCYRNRMMALNGTVDDELIVVGRDVTKAAKELMERRPDTTAIFAIQDPNAVYAVQGLQEMGLDVPGDVSVVGLDGVAQYIDDCPSITTVAFPHRQVGYLGAELLLKQIEDESLYYSNVLVRSTLVEGNTCAAPHTAHKKA